MAPSIRGNRVVRFNPGDIQEAILGGIEERPEGTPFEFWYAGKKHTWTRYRSDGRMTHVGLFAPAQLVGRYGRALLADALGMTLIEALAARRSNETDAERRERLAHQKHKEALAAVEREVRSRSGPRRSDW